MRPQRAPPAGRAGRALQIVFSEPAVWAALGPEDQHLLCELPAPHGPLFVWLDGQFHEHGEQPWAALREALRGHPQEAAAVQAVQGTLQDIQNDPGELQAILRQERRDALKRRMDEALAAHDLDSYQRLLAELRHAAA